MNAQIKRKPTRLSAVIDPIAQAVQLVTLEGAQAAILHMDKCIEELTIQRDQFDHAATEINKMLTDVEIERDFLRGQLAENNAMELLQKNGMLHAENKQLRAQLECAKADLCAAQNKIKRLEHSADYWQVLWTCTDRNLYTAQKFIGLLIGVLGMLLALWGVV